MTTSTFTASRKALRKSYQGLAVAGCARSSVTSFSIVHVCEQPPRKQTQCLPQCLPQYLHKLPDLLAMCFSMFWRCVGDVLGCRLAHYVSQSSISQHSISQHSSPCAHRRRLASRCASFALAAASWSAKFPSPEGAVWVAPHSRNDESCDDCMPTLFGPPPPPPPRVDGV